MASRHRCAICRQPSAAGARLCLPCRAALKRARDTTVSESWLPRRRTRRSPVAPPVALAGSAVPVSRPEAAITRDRAIRRPVAVTLVLLATVTGVALAIAQLRDPVDGLAPRYAVTEGQGATDPISAAKILPSLPVLTAPAAPLPVVAGRSLAEGDAPAAVARPPVPRALPRQATNPRGSPAPTVASLTTAETAGASAFGPVAELAPTPAPIQVEVFAPPAPAPPAPDRWQRLADALARCPEGLFARSVCQQTLRLEYCEGAWGRVAACPAQVERDYGN